MLEKNKSFAQASGRFQLECYKEEIEANLRTPGLGGFQLLDLHDYLGQGTALVGLLDAFWEPKGYATAEEFKDFCNTTVPLARLRQRVFTTADRFDVDVEIAHFGAKPLENVKGVWRIVGGDFERQGDWDPTTIPIGKNIPLGKISVDLSSCHRFANTSSSLVLVRRRSLVRSIRRSFQGPVSYEVKPISRTSGTSGCIPLSTRLRKLKLPQQRKRVYPIMPLIVRRHGRTF